MDTARPGRAAVAAAPAPTASEREALADSAGTLETGRPLCRSRRATNRTSRRRARGRRRRTLARAESHLLPVTRPLAGLIPGTAPLGHDAFETIPTHQRHDV